MWSWKLDWESLGCRLGCLSQLHSRTNNPHISSASSRSSTQCGQGMACGSFIFSESGGTRFLKSCSSLIPSDDNLQSQCYHPLHEHHTPTRLCLSQFCPWNQLYLYTRKRAGLWDMWISHPPLDSLNRWQYVCNLLEETAVNGSCSLKITESTCLKTKFLASERRTPWRCIAPSALNFAWTHVCFSQQAWLYMTSLAKGSDSAEVDSISHVRQSLSSLSSRKTVWRLNVCHGECVPILKSLFSDLVGRFASLTCMHQTHLIISWIGLPTDERKHLDCGIPSGWSHFSEHDVRLDCWAESSSFCLLWWVFLRWVEDDSVI